MTQDEFLGYLSKSMNAFGEQLSQMYITGDMYDFNSCAKIVSNILDNDCEDSDF